MAGLSWLLVVSCNSSSCWVVGPFACPSVVRRVLLGGTSIDHGLIGCVMCEYGARCVVGVGKVRGVAGWVVDTLLGPQGPSPVWLGLILVP